jgi:predicted short-subunit dehydrogenase-like oxidoreductase (DUF2520 family)
MSYPEEILLVGTGNLAAHLAVILSGPAGYRVDVAGRDPEKLETFCKTYGGLPFREEDDKFYQAVIICVSDQAIESSAARYGKKASCILHTSGASSLEILEKYHRSNGVFWPLQTFTAGREVSWEGLPVCIQASDQHAAAILNRLSEGTRIKAIESTSDQRLQYHLAAVFVGNFVNHLYVLSDIWCRENLLDFDALKPLILETARKVQALSPPEAQTGPAKRQDVASIDKHMAMLDDHPALKQVYHILSEQIMKRYQYLSRT